jgi:hypothetical protein
MVGMHTERWEVRGELVSKKCVAGLNKTNDAVKIVSNMTPKGG